jgi:hypothetical protein
MAQLETSSPAARTAAGRIEHARQQEARKIARRSFLRVSVFAGLILFVGSQVAGGSPSSTSSSPPASAAS